MKKKGFTLVELLAVIAILAILIIIALPNILGLFEESRKNTFETELKGIYKAAEEQWSSDTLFEAKEQVYMSCTGCNGKKIDTTGRSAIDYYIKVNKDGKVVEYYATDGNYQYSYYDEYGINITDITGVQKVTDMSSPEDVIDVETIVDSTTNIYYNASKDKYYQSLRDAISDASSNQTIKVMYSSNENKSVTIPNTISNLKIDLNSKTVRFENIGEDYPITNNGTLEIINTGSDTGTLSSIREIINNGTLTLKNDSEIFCDNTAISNSGTLNINSGYVVGYDGSGIENTGTINVSGGNINGYTSGIWNYNILNVTSGNISGTTAITNEENGTVTISNNVTLTANQTGIGNAGTFNATGGEITMRGSYTAYGVYNSGTANINGLSINNETSYSGSTTYGIYNNSGQLNFVSGSIIASRKNNGYRAIGIYNKANATISGGTIDVSSNKAGMLDAYGVYVEGPTTITGGTITSTYIAAYVTANKTLTLGKKDSTVNESSPVLYGNGTNGIGVNVVNNGIFKYYDGIVKSSKSLDKTIVGTINDLPSGYIVAYDNINGVPSAHLFVDVQ